jgi:hypothetical protein
MAKGAEYSIQFRYEDFKLYIREIFVDGSIGKWCEFDIANVEHYCEAVDLAVRLSTEHVESVHNKAVRISISKNRKVKK